MANFLYFSITVPALQIGEPLEEKEVQTTGIDQILIGSNQSSSKDAEF